MESIKDILNNCNVDIFYDYKNVGITEELNQVRKCIIKRLYKTIPHSRILASLSIIDGMVLLSNDNDIEIIFEKNHDLRENILYMIPFEKLIRDEQQTVKQQTDKANKKTLVTWWDYESCCPRSKLVNNGESDSYFKENDIYE